MSGAKADSTTPAHPDDKAAEAQRRATRIAQLERELPDQIAAAGEFVNPMDANRREKNSIRETKLTDGVLSLKQLMFYVSVMNVNAPADQVSRMPFPANPSMVTTMSVPLNDVKEASSMSIWELLPDQRGKGLEYFAVSIVTNGKTCHTDTHGTGLDSHDTSNAISFNVGDRDSAVRLVDNLKELAALYRDNQRR
jgi:hypothetical protein